MKNKKIISIFVCMLLFATGFTVAATSTKNEKNASTSSEDVDWWPMIGHDAANTHSSKSSAPITNETFMKKQVYSNFQLYSPGDRLPNLVTVVDEGKLFFINPTYPNDELYCINAGNGVKIYNISIVGNSGGSLDIAVSNGKIYIPRDIGLVCMDVDDKSVDWIYSSSFGCYAPIVADNQIYFVDDLSTLHCINTNGAQKWNAVIPMEWPYYAPAVSNGLVYVANGLSSVGQVIVYCLNANNGTLEWMYTQENYYQSVTPTVVDGKVFISASDVYSSMSISCVNAVGNGNGTTMLLWSVVKLPPDDGMLKSLAVVGNRIYGCAVQEEPYFTEIVFCLNADNGADIWAFDFNGINKNPTAPAIAEGKVYFGCGLNAFCLDAQGNGDGTTNKIWDYSPTMLDGRENFLAPLIGQGKVWIGQFNFLGIESDPYGFEYHKYGLIIDGFGSKNQAPATPDTPTGPSQGVVGQLLTYSTKTTDPDSGDQLWYNFSWGDGTNSGWVGLYDSGVTVEQTHKWTKAGTFIVRVQAKDSYVTTAYSTSLPVTIYQTSLGVGNITGGLFMVSSTVKNNGAVAATNVSWKITVKGGILGLIMVEKTGSFSTLAAGATESIKASPIVGLGKVNITISVTSNNGQPATKLADGSVFVILVSIK
jgi:outer membrane protein assembly factor BamB